MSSFRRVIRSQLNGTLLHGPLTGEGKRRSSANGIRQGLLAQPNVMENECREPFDELLQQHVTYFSPTNGEDLTGTELGMIETSAALDWRIRRPWPIENRLMDDEIPGQTSTDEVSRIAHTFTRLTESNQLAMLNRYEGCLQRAYARIYRKSERIAKNAGYQTNPVNLFFMLVYPD